MVSGSYFSVLGVRPALGRLIGASDDVRPGDHPVVVLSYDYWKNRLGSPADVIGRKVLLNNHPMTVIGVAASGFRGMDTGEPATLWIPATMAREATLEFDANTPSAHVLGACVRQAKGRRHCGGGEERTSAVVYVDACDRHEDARVFRASHHNSSTSFAHPQSRCCRRLKGGPACAAAWRGRSIC